MPKSKTLITASNIFYSAPQKKNGAAPLINDVSFEISNSNVTAIMGPNGAGKSLLLRLIANLIKPTSGTLNWMGLREPQRGDISIVFQKPILLRRSVKANLEHALKAAQNNTPIEHLLEQAQLNHLAQSPARVLSGGEQQRLALIRALASKPKILLLDEATASLDPSATALIESIIRNASKQGTKIIMVTHDFGQAKRLSNDIIFMAGGKILEHQKTSSFFKKPISKQAKAYLEGKLIV